MKKNDFIIVAILVALMFVWMKFYPAIEQKYFPRPVPPVTQNVEATPSAPQFISETKPAPVAQKPVLQDATGASRL